MRQTWWNVLSALALGSFIAMSPATPSGGLAGPSPQVAGQPLSRSGGWRSTAPMAHERAEPMMVRLQSGRVLVAGAGDASMSTMPCSASVEIFHPKANRWTSAAPLPHPLCGAHALVLNDGRVLVAGGFVRRGPSHIHATRSAWIYRPGADLWTDTGRMRRSRAYFAMAPLPGGRVLVAGGRTTWNGRPQRRSAEIYHPRTGRWHQTDPLHHRRTAQSAVVLADRDVLVAGGYQRTAERFDVRTRRWVVAGELREWVLIDPSLVVQRGGNVLAIGGGAKVDQYRTNRNVWRPFTPLPLRVQGGTALLADHHPLVMGGMTRNSFSARCLGWHPHRNAWLVDSKMPVPKALFGAVRLGRGSVLVAGGEVRHSEGVSYYTRSAARFIPK